MTDYTDLVERLRGPIKHPQQLINASHEAADAIELLQRELKCSKEMWEQQQELALEYLADIEKANERIAELEQEIDDYETIYKGSVVETQAKRIAELEHQLKVECDTYLWNRKLMSRRIAMLEYWMEKLFKYGSSPEARRNHLTMTTEIPDYLIREGEDILQHLEERSDAVRKVLGEKE